MKRHSYKCAKTGTLVIPAVIKMFRAEGLSPLNDGTFVNMVPSTVLQLEVSAQIPAEMWEGSILVATDCLHWSNCGPIIHLRRVCTHRREGKAGVSIVSLPPPPLASLTKGKSLLYKFPDSWMQADCLSYLPLPPSVQTFQSLPCKFNVFSTTDVLLVSTLQLWTDVLMF